MAKKENAPINEEEVKDEKMSYEELEEALTEEEEGRRLERYLKNEAYAFLLAEGLLDKFLEFREPYHRTKPQGTLFYLVSEADLGGLWIDLF